MDRKEVDRLVVEFDKLSQVKLKREILVKPSFIGVGAGRCGTSAIYSALINHPGCHLSPIKEVNYFGIRDKETTPTGLTYSEYLSYFLGADHDQVVGEISPAYLTFPESLVNLHKYLPDVKLILTLRNPLERFISQFKHHKNAHGLTSLEAYSTQAIEQFNAGFPNGKNWFSPAKNIYQSLYSEGTKYLLENYGRDKIHVICFHNLVANFSNEMRLLQEFLGLEQHLLPENRTNQSSEEAVDLDLSWETVKSLEAIFYKDIENLSELLGDEFMALTER
jgi:hypothetical protein